MYLDLAPMEGITTALYRRLHHEFFPGVDRYYAPFLSPTQDHRFTPRQLRELLPEHNQTLQLIPQILTKNPVDFLWAAGELAAMGYDEVNLNLGCPSGTVTAKGKGAGMLGDLDALDRFLDAIFQKAPCRISVKTRLGLETAAEFDPILDIFNRYPLAELIIHPRVRRDLYRHPVRQEAFDRALPCCAAPVSYNGSIVTPADHAACAARYPGLRGIMIGQGLISDPFLASRIRGLPFGGKQQLRDFLDQLLDRYTEQFGSRLNAMKRMKDVWFYQIRLFEGGEKLGKQILKSRTEADYQAAVAAVFDTLPLLEQSSGGW